MSANGSPSAIHHVIEVYHRGLRLIARALAVVAGAGLVIMVGVTCLDVVLRIFSRSLKGANDLVMIASAITVAAALPYTTAIKGHVAIEYFFHKLGPCGRTVVDTLVRLMGMTLFACLAWYSLQYGRSLLNNQQVSQTLQLPIFWVPWVMAFSFGLVILIKLYHLLHPGKAMLEP
jgi:TRAP-type C4-dicarboxylate transport system permease small subunit